MTDVLVLANKTVVLCVTGGIAAYRAADIASKLVQLGARVFVVMTHNASRFIGPVTFRAITHQPVALDLFEDAETWEESSSEGMEHISLADCADIVLIAPATANTIAKLAAGIADDVVTATVLATKAPVLIAPAMNTNMLQHPATQENIRRLEEFGYQVIESESGRLACGTVGPGRLAATETIVLQTQQRLERREDLKGLKVLVTAGPTREPIDPVRFVSNRSTGKMGYAVARAAQDRGADVSLISGPATVPPPPGCKLIEVETAGEMTDAVLAEFDRCEILVCAAAISDFRPKSPATSKIKKRNQASLILDLEVVPDFFSKLKSRSSGHTLVGFAAETDDLAENAKEKLTVKGLDLIVANDVTEPGAGFGTDTNIVSLITDSKVERLPLMSKREVADHILDSAVELHRQKKSQLVN